RAQGPAKVATPLAPVEAGAAERAAPLLQPRHVDPEVRKEPSPPIRQDKVPLARDDALPLQAVQQLDAPLTGEMVVANAGGPQRRVLRTGPDPHRARALGKAHQRLEHLRHVRTRQAEVAVPSLLLGRE